jgi:hypothetical protein
MKRYRVCIKSYESNNSEYAEYNVYIFKDDSELETAKIKAKEMINRLNKNSEGIIYDLFDMEEVK